ncbi:hypothetical protein RJ641_035115 [Dillenia turbinata]|uniref:Uncharacterized protein n=1 Tax=Dillenia turbinata TaxID=194707 RepID=A0AAN8VIP4_9MAGN
MVLWEITLATAYFLGLKRTYRLALKIQRRLISPKRLKLRNFVQRRTRMAFDVALTVLRNIQQRDLEVGRNFGTQILRILDRMKPSAQISGPPSKSPSDGRSNTNLTKQVTKPYQKTHGSIQGTGSKGVDKGSYRKLFTSAWQKPFPTITMMLRRPAGMNSQYRPLSICSPEIPRFNYPRSGFEGVIRKDIMEWMLRN